MIWLYYHCVEFLQDTLDRVFSWYRGNETPPMKPSVEDEEDESGQKVEDKEKSDPHLATQDVIKVRNEDREEMWGQDC